MSDRFKVVTHQNERSFDRDTADNPVFADNNMTPIDNPAPPSAKPTRYWLGWLAGGVISCCLIAGGFWVKRNHHHLTRPTPQLATLLTLQVGSLTKAALPQGQEHIYQLQLTPDLFSQITLIPGEFGLRYSVIDHLNRPVRQGKTRSFDRTVISLVGHKTGMYQLVLAPTEKWPTQNTYEIQLQPPRAATPTDQLRVTAEETMEKAERLNAQQTAPFWKQAIAEYERALKLWGELGEQQEKGFALLGQGVAHYNLSDETQALSCFKQALTIWQSLHIPAGEAETYFELANTHNDNGDYDLAQTQLRQSLTRWQTLHWPSRQTHVLISLAVNQTQLGNFQEALRLYQQAREVYQQIQHLPGVAMSLNGLAATHQELGEYQNAIDQALEALRLAQKINSLPQQQLAHSKSGEAYLALNKPAPALQHLLQALELSRQIADPRREAIALRRIGVAYELQGDIEKALANYLFALPINRQLKNRPELTTLLNLLGRLRLNKGESSQARQYLKEALAISQTTHNHASAITSLHHLAQTEFNAGRLAKAQKYSEQAIRLIESLRERIANRQLRESYFATVLKSHSLYADILMRQHKQHPQAGFAARAWLVTGQARARTLREVLNENRAQMQAGLPPTLLERERSLQQALNAKANRLIGATKPDELETLAREVRNLRRQLATVESEMRQTAPGYAALTQPAPISLRQVQRTLLDDQTALLEFSLGEERSYVWLINRHSVRSHELPKRSELEPQALRVLEHLTARLQTSVSGYGDHVRQADVLYWQEAAKLSKLILPAEWLKALKQPKLLVTSDGALQYLPFSALPLPDATNEALLLSKFEITNLPSIAVLAELRRQQAARLPRSKMLAVLVDPVYNDKDDRMRTIYAKLAGPTSAATQSSTVPSSFQVRGADGTAAPLPRLLNAEDEAKAVCKYATPEQCLILKGLDVNRSVLENSRLSDYQILHFATHGHLDGEHPELSGLFLSYLQPDGKSSDSLLRMHEIYRLKLPAELIVLSACETALGKYVRGEGLIALTRGFMYAGATRVVASLWKVNDATTPILMDDFYAGMLKEKLSPAAALRQAQLKMLDNPRTRAPFYWAAFILQGEPRNFSSPLVSPTQR